MGEVFDGNKLSNEREEFLEQARYARQKRADDQKRHDAVIVIQTCVRQFLVKRRIRGAAVEKFENLMLNFSPEDEPTVHSTDVFHAANTILQNFDPKCDLPRLEKLCRYVNWSLTQECPQFSYIGCGFHKDQVMAWIQHLKDLVVICVKSMSLLKPELVSDSKLLSILLNTVVSLASVNGWKIIKVEKYKSLEPGMAKLSQSIFSYLVVSDNYYENIHAVLNAALVRPGKFSFKKTNLLAIATLTNRPLHDAALLNDTVVLRYVNSILSVPAYVYHVQSMCPEGLDVTLLPIILKTLYENEELLLSFFGNDMSVSLSILANLIDMGQHYEKLNEEFHPTFATVISKLLSLCCCIRSENIKKSHWHPILGWVNRSVPASFLNVSAAVKNQIEYLWGPVYLEALFFPLHHYLAEISTEVSIENTSGKPAVAKCTIKGSVMKAFRKILFMDSIKTVGTLVPSIKFTSDVTMKIAQTCNLYNSIIKTFALCKLDILTGICFKQSSKLLSSLLKFLQLLGSECGLRGWVDVLHHRPRQIQESVIVMFSDAMIHFITILDDQEMYEDQHVFTLEELSTVAQFVNQLCYRLITDPHHHIVRESAWTSLKTLLMVLYRRDCRRKYCPDDHWLIETSKMTQLIHDIEKGKKNAKRVLLDMPHVLREDARVIFFRKWASSEKTLNGNSVGEHDLPITTSGSTLITIQRGRIVEDGYAQLASLSPKALKATIRVRFQNELGLDEAGIDQDGVFKEFLEETINAVFNPSLNLFKGTSENLLYPSPLSYLHENHLQLFEFVGKMLAKAIYEGIVVDVHFAPFFLSQILGHQQSALFSAIDELQSLDRELYTSLTYIKHYEGNVQDLELTFSVDQDALGAIRTTELIAGGRTVSVTNENKISYLYLMAHFHLYLQIKEQTAAFLKGFRCIIPNEWIRIFSPPELQRLISGQDSDIDLNDLRRNTQYYGGFHDNHRVIMWLWEILESDFDENERQLFLKFVTSCSKPPLLGFMNLDPPFSIRCVEVSDDEDTGDTIGSVLRGFLTIGRKDPIGRLPTSSTCFNLLKLPNYQKKSTLLSKLKYAITANVGFELS